MKKEIPAWRWPTSESMKHPQPEETFEDVLEWTKEEENEFLKKIDPDSEMM